MLEQLSRGIRERYMALDPHAAPEGELRSILCLPASPDAMQSVRLLKRLSNHNICLPQLLDYEALDDELRIVTTWVTGPDIRSYLAKIHAGNRRRGISPTEVVRLLRGLAHGLAQLLRSHAIIHGDLKPENLILTRKPTRLVMIDYGSAWRLSRTRLRSAGDGISPAYAAPELQAGDRVPDARCDQFSASVIAYEMLTGRLPYDSLGGQAGLPEYRSRMNGVLIPPS